MPLDRYAQGQRSERLSAAALMAGFADQAKKTSELNRPSVIAIGDDPVLPQETFLIGIATATGPIPDMQHPVFGNALWAAKSRLMASGCDVLHCSFHNWPDRKQFSFLERFEHRGVDGLIVMGLGRENEELAPILSSDNPCVFIDFDPIGRNVGYVMSNSIEGMARVVRHLHALGRRRIAHITGLANTTPGANRLLGYRGEMERLGLEIAKSYVQHGDYFDRSGFEAARRLLELSNPPEAIACASDMMAVGAIAAIEEVGLRVPEDIAVTGFDDADFAAWMRPALTTVRQDALGLGAAAADALVHMLRRPDEPPVVWLLPTELVARESCGLTAGPYRREAAA